MHSITVVSFQLIIRRNYFVGRMHVLHFIHTTESPSYAADPQSVLLGLIAYLGGILTEFRPKFARIELWPGPRRVEQEPRWQDGWKMGFHSGALQKASNRKSFNARPVKTDQRTHRHTHEHVYWSQNTEEKSRMHSCSSSSPVHESVVESVASCVCCGA